MPNDELNSTWYIDRMMSNFYSLSLTKMPAKSAQEPTKLPFALLSTNPKASSKFVSGIKRCSYRLRIVYI